MDLRFDLLDFFQAADVVVQMAAEESFSYVVTPNVDHVVQYHSAPEAFLPHAYDSADLLLCDSRIIAGLARLCGVPLPIVTGSDLTGHLLAQGRLRGHKIAVVGGDALLHQQLRCRYPSSDWHFFEPAMGVRFDPAARREIHDFIEYVRADVSFFAFGAPQSELTCAEIAARGRARGVALCIGSSLEFVTGAKRRAPVWMQRTGLEWLHRLLSEPRRLWRRYLIDGPKILPIWWRWYVARDRPREVSDSKPSGDA
jgi:exopolysaccharide biosynthesis WecB/TagA/CpsF family protein